MAYVEPWLPELGLTNVLSISNILTPRGVSILLVPGAVVYLWRSIRPRGKGEPPIVAHWVPWLGSALKVQNNPDGLFKQARRELGPVFGIKAFGSTLYHVSDADLIAAVYKQPHAFSASPMAPTFLHIVYDISMDAITGSSAVPEMIDSMHRQLSPAHFVPLLDNIIPHARSQIQSLPTQTPISLLSATVNPMRNADCAMLFGSSFLARYDSALASTFKTFSHHVPLMAINFPAILMPAAVKARQTLIDTLGAYFDAGIPEDASDLVKEFADQARAHDWTTRDLAAYALGVMWPVLANAPYGVYWLLAYHLRRPEGLAPLVYEIESVLASGQPLGEVVRDSNATPYLDACIQETIRLASDSYSVRWVAQDGARIGRYEFRAGDQLVCNTRGVHMNEGVYKHPERFDPERFMDGAKDTVCGQFIPFGGGFSVCSGRHLAQAQMKAYIILLLSEFEASLADERQDTPTFSPGNRGFGMIRPVGDISVRLAKKKPSITGTRIVDSPVVGLSPKQSLNTKSV